MLTGAVKTALQQAPFIIGSAVACCRKVAADQIRAPNYGYHEEPLPKQDVVLINIVPDRFPEQNTASQMHFDNSHTIEVTTKDIIILRYRASFCHFFQLKDILFPDRISLAWIFTFNK